MLKFVFPKNIRWPKFVPILDADEIELTNRYSYHDWIDFVFYTEDSSGSHEQINFIDDIFHYVIVSTTTLCGDTLDVISTFDDTCTDQEFVYVFNEAMKLLGYTEESERQEMW